MVGVWNVAAGVVGSLAQAINSHVTGRIAMGACFGGLMGALPLAYLLTKGALIPALLMGAGVGAIAGFFYDLGHRHEEHYWREQQRLDLDWRIKQDELRRRGDDDELDRL